MSAEGKVNGYSTQMARLMCIVPKRSKFLRNQSPATWRVILFMALYQFQRGVV
jgi:hypothetical protein